MKVLVTGSAGHLGEGLMRALRASGHQATGLDIVASAYTDVVGSIVDRAFVRGCMAGADAVLHAATLHKPHIGTHDSQDFVDTNITGTLNLLREAAAAHVGRFVYTSTTSAFGAALTPSPGQPAAWITEDVLPVTKNIYGATKLAAEHLCATFRRSRGLPCIVLRTSRFFPEADDDATVRQAYADANVKANEFLYRRVDLEDAVDAHLLAMEKAPDIGFDCYIISATTPFTRDDLQALRIDAASVVDDRAPDYRTEYARRGWTMFPAIDRVYVNDRARARLGWRPRHDFASVIGRLRNGGDVASAFAREVGAKGYHDEVFSDGPYPVQ